MIRIRIGFILIQQQAAPVMQRPCTQFILVKTGFKKCVGAAVAGEDVKSETTTNNVVAATAEQLVVTRAANELHINVCNCACVEDVHIRVTA